MINFTVKTKLPKMDLNTAIKKSLWQSVVLVQWKAVNNAPYLTWNLKRSIWVEVKQDYWIVGTNVKYAKLREYVNRKNPHTKFYMKRALESSLEQIKWYFAKNIWDLWANK